MRTASLPLLRCAVTLLAAQPKVHMSVGVASPANQAAGIGGPVHGAATTTLPLRIDGQWYDLRGYAE